MKIISNLFVSTALLALSSWGVVKQPNIIIYIVDDLGVMDSSAPFLADKDGNPVRHPLNDHYRTPNLERLAESGIRFSQFYAQSVCSPSRTSLLNGQNATRHGTTQWIKPTENNRGEFGPSQWNWEGFKENDFTIQAHLQSIGYQTIHIGKAHFGPLGHHAEIPTNIGFDVNIGGASWGRPASYYAANQYGNLMKGKPNTMHAVPHLEKYYESGEFLTEALTLEANDQIEKASQSGKPFFMHLSQYAVHSPFDSDPRFAANYAQSKLNKREQAFATLVEGVDHSLGQVIEKVKSLGIGEETIIFYLGDNGTDSPTGGHHEIGAAAPLRGKKATEMEGGMRAPLLASWVQPNPNNEMQKAFPIKSGAMQPQVAAIMDLVPTILDLTDSGAKVPSDHIIDGTSLKTQLSGTRNESRDDTFLMHFPHKHRGSYFTVYREGDWKVIYQYLPEVCKIKKRYRLYNLADDLSESNDLAPSMPEKVNELMGKMIQRLNEENALYPEKNGKELRPQLMKF